MPRLKHSLTDLKNKSINVREDVLDMVTAAKDGHIPSALSMVEILITLYYAVMSYDSRNPKWPNRDRFVLSKGHGCASLYSILADVGFFSKEELKKFSAYGGILGGHPDKDKVPGIELSTGSLGHGLPMAVGFALSAKFKKQLHHTYVVVGDGECNEGTIWEAAAMAAHQQLDNLTVIVDFNKQQSSGSVYDVINPLDMVAKWRAFGWEVAETDGHDFNALFGALALVPKKPNKPTAIIAHTIKGKGISFMENEKKWHTMIPSEAEFVAAKAEMSKQREELKQK